MSGGSSSAYQESVLAWQHSVMVMLTVRIAVMSHTAVRPFFFNAECTCQTDNDVECVMVTYTRGD